MTDHNEFFREATIRLCSSLDIETALGRCYGFLRAHLPAGLLSMSYISPGEGGIRVLAQADEHGGRRPDLLIPLPEAVIALATGKDLPDVSLIDDLARHPIARFILPHAPSRDISMISVRLILDGQALGTISLFAGERGVYTEEHVVLFALLREPAAITLSNHLRFREVHRLKELLAEDNRDLREELHALQGGEVIGRERGLRQVVGLVRQVAPLESPVILLGETGTGKELIARAIHESSPRRQGPFIKVNCGAIPETLIDSELFGHEKGAFTGALAQKRGRFERAHGGTIFLDEIGELPLNAQVRLLRVLQEKEIERVGGSRTIKVDIRVLAATHRDLPAMVAAGRFREDLFFRLEVFPIHIPPLRDRRGDIPALVHHFMHQKALEMKMRQAPTLAAGALERLAAYAWPGNVRELENAVERELIVSQGRPLAFGGLQPREEEGRETFGQTGAGDAIVTLDACVAEHIRRALRQTGGRVEGRHGAATLLGVNAATLRHRMRKLGIPFGRKTGGGKKVDLNYQA